MAARAVAADLSIAKQFFPTDSMATVEEPAGTPPAAIVHAGDGRLLGYAFSTRDVPARSVIQAARSISSLR